MYIRVKAAIPQKDHIVLMKFENGEQRLFDVNPYMDSGIFKELNDPKIFETVRPSFDTIEWDNEADIDPEVLYAQSVKID